MGGGGTYRNHSVRPRTTPKLKSCRCGGGCGLTWEYTGWSGQGARKYHPECPVIAVREKERKAFHNAQVTERRRAERQAAKQEKDARKRGQPRKQPEEKRVLSPWRKPRYGRFCEGCGGLSHRRPPEGCNICLLPYAPERLENQPIQRVSSTSWDA